MVKILLVLVDAILRIRVFLAELAGAALVVAGAAVVYRPAGLVVAGLAVLAKSFEWDISRPGGDRE